MSEPTPSSLGVVVIGRNEGQRLMRCFDSLDHISPIVYVDSGSTDDSVAAAQRRGIATVNLDMSVPFTAARARNAGFKRLREINNRLPYVQFVDGDCELISDWLPSAQAYLAAHPQVGMVCGRLRERHPEQSIYNRLCDMEWDRPEGEVDATGGIFLMRADLFEHLGGFREDLVAGEEPELCWRARLQGWKVWRLAQHMAWHDAAMLHFSQWWTRTQRTGFGTAQAAYLRGSLGDKKQAAPLLRPWLWVVVIPLSILTLSAVWGALSAWLALVYPLQILRTMRSLRGEWPMRWARSGFLMVGKLPELLGQCRFWLDRRGRRSARAFDYKQASGK